MPESSYDPVLSGKASAFLISLSRSKQRKAIALAFQLAAYPYQIGDYPTEDENGRPIQNILIGEWHFSYWADHSVKELRIVDIIEV